MLTIEAGSRRSAPSRGTVVLAAAFIVAAVVYTDDMYVDRDLSEGTADTVSNLRVWATDEYEHNGLTAGRERALDRLIGLVRAV